jgi:hypothetical protein
MIKLKYIRPNTVGVTFEDTFDSYAECEELIERRCERLADQGWELSELKGSDSRNGTIECTHDDQADVLLIQWRTPTAECRHCGCDFDVDAERKYVCSEECVS